MKVVSRSSYKLIYQFDPYHINSNEQIRILWPPNKFIGPETYSKSRWPYFDILVAIPQRICTLISHSRLDPIIYQSARCILNKLTSTMNSQIDIHYDVEILAACSIVWNTSGLDLQGWTRSLLEAGLMGVFELRGW